MTLSFFGVRGSHPVAGCQVSKYGGNTSSLLIENDDSLIVLDAGTGIINIGNYIYQNKKKVKTIHIFLTHFHFDHIQGLPFFLPFFDDKYKINIFSAYDEKISLENTVYTLFNHPYSPISNAGIKAELRLNSLDLSKTEPIKINDIQVEYRKENSHPLSGVLVYKITNDGQIIVFATDVESPNGFSDEIIQFAHGADYLIHDSQYFESDYRKKDFPKIGFGHSTFTMAVNNALKAQVKKLYLFHFDPSYSDQKVEKMLFLAKKIKKESFLAREFKRVIIRR